MDKTVFFVVVVGPSLLLGEKSAVRLSIEGVRCKVGVWRKGEEVSFDSRLYISLPERRRYLYILMPEWLGQGGGSGRSSIGLSQEGGGAGHSRGGGCGGGRVTFIAISCPWFVEGVWERGGVWGTGGEVCFGWRSAE